MFWPIAIQLHASLLHIEKQSDFPVFTRNGLQFVFVRNSADTRIASSCNSFIVDQEKRKNVSDVFHILKKSNKTIDGKNLDLKKTNLLNEVLAVSRLETNCSLIFISGEIVT